jgi:hypothetical protein
MEASDESVAAVKFSEYERTLQEKTFALEHSWQLWFDDKPPKGMTQGKETSPKPAHSFLIADHDFLSIADYEGRLKTIGTFGTITVRGVYAHACLASPHPLVLVLVGVLAILCHCIYCACYARILQPAYLQEPHQTRVGGSGQR